MKAACAIGGGLIALALLWWTVAVPAIVKYPTTLNVTPQYTGAFTTFVNTATGAPLASPTAVPLIVDRHIQAVGKESGSSRVVVKETITERAGHLVLVQNNVYVMDRRTLKNVADPRASAFEPSNVVDRSGDYRLNLPFDTSSARTYPIYKNEIGTTYTMRSDAATPTTDEAGLRLHNFTGSVTDVPLASAYLALLNTVVPLPSSTTLNQLKPQLKAAGLDVDTLLGALAPTIRPADVSTLGKLAVAPIPLQYVMSFDGRAAVDPLTGAEVDVVVTESVGAKPILAGIGALQVVLSHYPNVPAAVAATKALGALSARPATTLFSYHYQQTPASVASIAHTVKALRNRIRLAKVLVPFGLLGGAGVVLALGGWRWWRRRPGPPAEVQGGSPAEGSDPAPKPIGIGVAS